MAGHLRLRESTAQSFATSTARSAWWPRSILPDGRNLKQGTGAPRADMVVRAVRASGGAGGETGLRGGPTQECRKQCNRAILILMPTHKLTPAIIKAAIAGFEQQKLRIDAQIGELRAMLPGGRTAPADVPVVPKGKRRKMSAAARKRLSEGQRKRWSASKGVSESPSTPLTTEPTKPKRRIS